MGRLHDQMKRDLELKNYSPKTRACYLASVKSVALYFRRSPEQLSDQEIREYLHYLIQEKKASQSVISQAYSALKLRALLMTIYSAGLRVSEVVHLKVSDIDSQRMVIRVQQGKGEKDRYTLLAKRTLEVLRDYWRAYRPEIGRASCRERV